MKTLKWFSMEWIQEPPHPTVNIAIHCKESNGLQYVFMTAETEQQAFQWLENNGYIERTKEDEQMDNAS